MKPNGRNRNYNPNRNRENIEEGDEMNSREYQNYGGEYDDWETGSERSGGRYGSGQGRSQSQQYPPSGYYNRNDEPRRSLASSDEGYRDYGRTRQGSDDWSDRDNYGSGPRGGWNQGYGQSGNYGQSQRSGSGGFYGSNQGSGQGRSSLGSQNYDRSGNYGQNYRSGRGSQQEMDSDYYYGRGNYESQTGSNWRDNQYSSSGMGYGDAEEQGRYGNRSGSQQSERQGRHFGKGPKGYQRSDERIKEDVNEALSRHWDLDASDIEVQVQNGEVTLTGTVDSREAKRYAEDAAERSFGVKDVENKLKVKKDRNASWSSEMDTSSTSSSSKSGSKSGESSSTMGDVRRGAGTTSGSRS